MSNKNKREYEFNNLEYRNLNNMYNGWMKDYAVFKKSIKKRRFSLTHVIICLKNKWKKISRIKRTKSLDVKGVGSLRYLLNHTRRFIKWLCSYKLIVISKHEMKGNDVDDDEKSPVKELFMGFKETGIPQIIPFDVSKNLKITQFFSKKKVL